MLSIIKLRKLTIGCLDTEMYVLITFLGNKALGNPNRICSMK